MEEFKKEIQGIVHKEIQEHQIDWHKIKEIICGIAASMKIVISMLPAGMIKNILMGIASVLEIICQQIPG